MNEKLLKLLQEAGTDSSGKWMSVDNVERLVQLILIECSVALTEMHSWQSVNNQNYPSAWHDAVDQCMEQLHQHFKS